MSLSVRPQREDFFPKTRRGHGTTHPSGRLKAGVLLRQGNPCVDSTCNLNQPKSNNLHTDQEANVRDWCEEHRLSVFEKSKVHALAHDQDNRGRRYTTERRYAKYRTPMEALYGATGGFRR